MSIDRHLDLTVELTVADIVTAGTTATATPGGVVQDQFDVTLEDVDLLGEVELTTNLIIAASESEDRLSPSQIDDILGVDAEPDGA